MKPEFTPDGIEVQTYQEAYDEIADALRDIYGDDINLDTDSPDGQRVGILAKLSLDLQTYGLTLYQQLDPDLALGQALNRLIKLSGITRRVATRSQVDVTITTDRPLTLPADYQVEDDLGQTWVTLSAASLSTGANAVTLFAQNFGAVEADPGTVVTPVTIVIGVLSVTNAAAATVGRDEETDEELRIRRNKSLETPATSTIGGLFTAIGNLPGVTDLAVYENDQDTTDVELDIPPHTVWAVVEGGAVDDIIEVIAKNKTGGTGLKGAVEGDYIETVQKPNGDTFIITHEMKFDRPTLVPLHVRATITRKDPTVPADLDLIDQLLVAREWTLNENASASDLYRTVYGAGDTFFATDLEISLDGIAWTDEWLETAPDEKFTIDADDITLTEVVP